MRREFCAIGVIGACIAFLSLTGVVGARGDVEFVPSDSLSSRVYTNWDGTYGFSEDYVLGIEGQEDLHLLMYRHVSADSTPWQAQWSGQQDQMVIDYVVRTSDGFRILRRAEINDKGTTPIFDWACALPGETEAEVIVSWWWPGNGGLRHVESFRYGRDVFEKLHGANRLQAGHGRKLTWVLENSGLLASDERYARWYGVQGQRDLRVIVGGSPPASDQAPGSSGGRTPLEFRQPQPDGRARLLKRIVIGDVRRRGLVPDEDISIIPAPLGAEIFVNWRRPDSSIGAMEKFVYQGTTVTRMTGADAIADSAGHSRWVRHRTPSRGTARSGAQPDRR